MDETRILNLGTEMLSSLPVVWTFLLLSARFFGLVLVLPGIGQGFAGLAIRLPLMLVLALASLEPSHPAPLPANPVGMAIGVSCEIMLGFALAFIPMFIVAGAQTAGQIASTAMGLGGAQLFDPTSGAQVSDISRIMGELVVVVFLLLGGHHAVVYAASGLGGQITPGSFSPGSATVEVLISQSAQIFNAAVMLSAPAVVALLLTQFVLGLVSRAVPTVNIFIISFPLTIGIGLILTVLSLPEMGKFVTREFEVVQGGIEIIASDAKTR